MKNATIGSHLIPVDKKGMSLRKADAHFERDDISPAHQRERYGHDVSTVLIR